MSAQHYYITQERSMAPGISGEWPKMIPKPDNPNGRLVKVGIHEILKEADERDLVRELQRRGREVIVSSDDS